MTYILISFTVYLLLMLGVGFWSARARTGSTSDFFLGGRRLGSLAVALSAVVSGRSSWLILGVAGAAWASGIKAVWVLPGYVLMELFMFLTIGKRLRRFTQKNDDLTIPDFFESRFRDRSGLLRIASVSIIVFFFTMYISSQLGAGQRAFSMVFEFEDVDAAVAEQTVPATSEKPEPAAAEVKVKDILPGLILTTVIVALYTVLGGYTAVALTDVIQAFFMLLCLVALPIIGMFQIGFQNLFDFLGEPDLNMLAFGTLLSIVNGLSIGFGSVGNPHILVRHMSIRDAKGLGRSALIGTFWNVIMGWGAVCIGLVARYNFRDASAFPDLDREFAFLYVARQYFHPLLFGFAVSALIAAVMSTVDSQLLVISSGISRDLYQKVLRRNSTVSEKRMVAISRLSVLGVIILAFLLGILITVHKKDWPIFKFVLLAWSGLGAAFGPALIFSLYWKGTTKWGVLAGFVGGLASTLLWVGLFKAKTGLAEYLPGFAFAVLCVVLVSLLTSQTEYPSTET